MSSKIAGIITALAIFVYSQSFTAAYSMPKLAVLSCGLLVLAFFVVAGAKVNTGPLFWHGVLFIAACAISTFFAADPWLGVIGRHNDYAMGLLGLSIVLIYYSVGGDISMLPAAGAILGVLSLAQYLGVGPLPMSDLTGNRAYATIGSPVQLGTLLAVLLPLAMKSPIYTTAIIIGLLTTGSRGSWIAAAIGVFVAKKSA